MKILITGAAGFIGYHLVCRLIKEGHEVVGLDNINDYYNPKLKYDRLKQIGIEKSEAELFNKVAKSNLYNNLKFLRVNLEDRKNLPTVFRSCNFDIVCNLAAQAGVRYSLENPDAYIDSNVVGFHNLLECSRRYHVPHFVYASSSSVYGQNMKVPFSVEDNVDHPVSLYAATKKSNELMAYTYSHLYGIKTTGLRFFTVYGPWGRPDMAMFLFTSAILKNEKIKVFNHGNLERDFTYVDDIINGLFPIIQFGKNQKEMYKIYNIGNSRPVKLMDFINEIETQLGKVGKKVMLPMQPGDVNKTWADTSLLEDDFNYKPKTSITEGVREFIKWYKNYYIDNVF